MSSLYVIVFYYHHLYLKPLHVSNSFQSHYYYFATHLTVYLFIVIKDLPFTQHVRVVAFSLLYCSD